MIHELALSEGRFCVVLFGKHLTGSRFRLLICSADAVQSFSRHSIRCEASRFSLLGRRAAANVPSHAACSC